MSVDGSAMALETGSQPRDLTSVRQSTLLAVYRSDNFAKVIINPVE
jgi:hypothetical protein